MQEGGRAFDNHWIIIVIPAILHLTTKEKKMCLIQKANKLFKLFAKRLKKVMQELTLPLVFPHPYLSIENIYGISSSQSMTTPPDWHVVSQEGDY